MLHVCVGLWVEKDCATSKENTLLAYLSESIGRAIQYSQRCSVTNLSGFLTEDPGSYSMAEKYACLTANSLTHSQIRHFFHPKSIDFFLISPQNHMLWVLIRSALMRCF